MKILMTIVLCLMIATVSLLQDNRLHEFHLPCEGLDDLPFVSQPSEMKELDSIGIDGVEVAVKNYKLAEEQILFLETCGPKKKESVIGDPHLGRLAAVVREFRRYDVRQKAFAYRFTVYIVMARNGFVTERYGASGEVLYADEDGDGKFEQVQLAMGLRFLPDWVKALAQQPIN